MRKSLKPRGLPRKTERGNFCEKKTRKSLKPRGPPRKTERGNF